MNVSRNRFELDFAQIPLAPSKTAGGCVECQSILTSPRPYYVLPRLRRAVSDVKYNY